MLHWVDTSAPIVPNQTNIYVGDWQGTRDELHELATSFGEIVNFLIFSKLENQGLCGHVDAVRAIAAMNNIQKNGVNTRASWNLKPRTEDANALPLPVEYFDIHDLTSEQRHEILWCIREYENNIEKYKKEQSDNVLNFIYDDIPPPTASSPPKINYSHKVAPDYRHRDSYKTQMCRFYERGTCQRGSTCQYAHSRYELEKYRDERY